MSQHQDFPAKHSWSKMPIMIINIFIQLITTSLDFDLEEDYVPEGFFPHDIKTKNSHHLMFANDTMIGILSCSKNWFVGGTLQIVRQRFTQFISIHALIKFDKSLKQIPLMFVIMSGN